MPTYLSFTCSRSDQQKLDRLIRALTPVFGKHGGVLLDRQGPRSGFFDPSLQGMAEIRVFRFPVQAKTRLAMAESGYAATAVLRASFSQLDIRFDDA